MNAHKTKTNKSKSQVQNLVHVHASALICTPSFIVGNSGAKSTNFVQCSVITLVSEIVSSNSRETVLGLRLVCFIVWCFNLTSVNLAL